MRVATPPSIATNATVCDHLGETRPEVVGVVLSPTDRDATGNRPPQDSGTGLEETPPKRAGTSIQEGGVATIAAMMANGGTVGSPPLRAIPHNNEINEDESDDEHTRQMEEEEAPESYDPEGIEVGMEVETLIRHTRVLMEGMFGPSSWSPAQDAIMREATTHGSRTYGVSEANRWALHDLREAIPDIGKTVGEEYLPCPEVVEACEDYIRQHRGLTEAARTRLKELEKDRLSPRRVGDNVSDSNPDKARMEKLARPGGGADILTPPDFRPNWECGLDRDPRGAASRAGDAAVARMTMESFVHPGLGLVVSEEFARKYITDTHENPSAWAPKHNKEKGRNCLNCSFRMDTTTRDTPGAEHGSGQALNSKWLRAAAREEWGVVYHPTINKIAAMIHAAIMANGGTSEGLLLWKMDLNGAFQLISFRAEDVHLMATRIASDFIVYLLCGTFGWGGTPMVFQVVTRTILWELRNNASLGFRGLVEMYVDDLMGICRVVDWKHVERVVRTYCEALLGTGAIAQKKTEFGRKLDGIGYSLDLDKYRVGIAHHNVLKALYVNMQVDVDALVPVRTMEALAAHASRYKAVCPPMAPFARALHRSYRTAGRHKGSKVHLDEDAKRSVWLMRGLLGISQIQATEYTRSFASFALRDEAPQWIVEFDASLTGIGIIWYEVDQAGVERAVGCCSIAIEWMDLTVSNYQNTVEFLAGMIGIRELARRGHRNVCVRFRGDSVSALAWARRDGFRSDLVQNAAIAYVVTKWRTGIEVGSTIHLPHGVYDYNWRTDWLSRGHTREQVLWRDGNDTEVLETEGSRLSKTMETWDVDAKELLELCHPDRPLGSQDVFLDWWKGLNTALFN